MQLSPSSEFWKLRILSVTFFTQEQTYVIIGANDGVT